MIFTIGHSTRSIEDFLSLLKENSVSLLVDVRTLPGSRRYPQFNQEPFSIELAKNGIEYVHLKVLGGLRHPLKNSTNSAWRNSGFRGYADYMQTTEFEHGIEQLVRLAKQRVTSIMCAEAVPWRCHRMLLSDALVAHGVNVEHILSAKSRTWHTLTKWAKVKGPNVTYPAPVTPRILRTRLSKPPPER